MTAGAIDLANRREFLIDDYVIDRIHWDKPELGLVEAAGSSRTNIVIDNYQNCFCSFLDTRPGVPPGQRYKASMEFP